MLKTNKLDASTISGFRYSVKNIGQRTSLTPRTTGILPVVSNAIATPKTTQLCFRTPPANPEHANPSWHAEKCDWKGGILDNGEAYARRERNSMSRKSNQNRLIAIEDSSGLTIAEYAYDSQFRRIRCTVPGDTDIIYLSMDYEAGK